MLLDENRNITHLDLDTFFVSVERLRNPKLLGKPIVVGGNGERGVVASCSYEAREYGIHSAMPISLAKRYCKDLIIVRGDMEAYSKYSGIVTDIIEEKVPAFQKSSIDEFYVDMTGMDRFFNCWKMMAELKQRIYKESGLPISYALGINKLISKVATNEVKPNGAIEIIPGREKMFLAPLSIKKLPGIGEATAYLLTKMGVETVQGLTEIPIENMDSLLGKNGQMLWRRANGIDDSPVVPFHEQKSISTENTFDTDTTDMVFLNKQLVKMTEHIAFELRSQNRLTGTVEVKLRYSNFDTEFRQARVTYTNLDNVLFNTVKDLFKRLYTRRMLIRLVGITFKNLIPGNYQINLFEDTQEHIQLSQAVDSIKRQYGEKAVFRAAGF
jgi:DNA polymerase-4